MNVSTEEIAVLVDRIIQLTRETERLRFEGEKQALVIARLEGGLEANYRIIEQHDPGWVAAERAKWKRERPGDQRGDRRRHSPDSDTDPQRDG